MIDTIIKNASNLGASDLHIEPYSGNFRSRLRINGKLSKGSNLSKHEGIKLIAQAKVRCGINSIENRLPLDGKLKVKLGDSEINCRISTCPCGGEERLVIRILGAADKLLQLDEIGMTTQQLDNVRKAMNKPQGLILITGPTGSGKTTTLYAILKELEGLNKNILSIEDPIEVDIPGINQVNVNSKVDLTFARALRAFMRQDPDIIMIGEIRDAETADTAIKASLTGHLVLATLHCKSIADTAIRLKGLGINKIDFKCSVNLVISQTLLKTNNQTTAKFTIAKDKDLFCGN